MAAQAENPNGAACQVRFSLTLFSPETVKKAAFRFTDRCAFDFAVTVDEIVCDLRCPGGQAEVDEVSEALRREVLDQDLRSSIAMETSAVRNAILAYAFSRTGLQSDEQV